MKENDSFCYRLNETAGFVWDRLQTPKTSQNLLTDILKHFDVNKELAFKDLEFFLKTGLKKGFLILKH